MAYSSEESHDASHLHIILCTIAIVLTLILISIVVAIAIVLLGLCRRRRREGRARVERNESDRTITSSRGQDYWERKFTESSHYEYWRKHPSRRSKDRLTVIPIFRSKPPNGGGSAKIVAGSFVYSPALFVVEEVPASAEHSPTDPVPPDVPATPATEPSSTDQAK